MQIDESNVDPAVHRPWNLYYETTLGSGERFPTLKFSGYEPWGAGLCHS